MSQRFKKNLVLLILFIFPVLTYLFFSSGVNNFARLPVIQETISEIDFASDVQVQLKDKITVLGYWGKLSHETQVQALNLMEIIYSRFNGFHDFQFVILVETPAISKIENLKQKLAKGGNTDFTNWHFILSTPSKIQEHFQSLNTPFSLDSLGGSPQTFIVDKDLNLRGRDDRSKSGELHFGYDARSIVDLSNNMVDDVKVILAEYRLALKENNPKNSDQK